MISITRKILSKFKFLFIRIIAPAIINAVYFFAHRKEKTLLVIKNDGIGDYILFRNYLSFLKSSEKFKDYQIYLLVNPASKDFAVYLDAKFVTGFFCYGDDYFLKWKLVKLLLHLQRLRLDTIIYPNYSRKYAVDWLIRKIRAKNKVAVDGNTVNESIVIKNESNSFYTELIKVSDEPVHEFDRNRQIMEILTAQKCDFSKPYIKRNDIKVVENYSVIIFTGASDIKRKWSPLNFNHLCRLIISELKTNIILAGGHEEINEGEKIENGIPVNYLSNRIGLTNLVELSQLISGAKLLISADTVAIHIAAALSIPAICISKGDLYGRFIPYPSGIYDQIYNVFPRSFIANRTNYNKWSSLNINDVLVEDVYRAAKNALKT